MMEEINCLNISPSDYAFFISFFTEQIDQGCFFWDPEQTYTYKNRQFRFVQPLVYTQRKDRDYEPHQEESIKLRVLGEEIDSGSKGKIFSTLGTLTVSPNLILLNTNNKKIIKKQAIRTERETIAIQNEYKFTSRPQHLKIKAPTFFNKISYTAMKKVKGVTAHFICKDPNYKKNLTIEDKKKLSINLFNALKTQVTDHGIWHKDISFSNVIINPEKNLKVTIIDYGEARENNRKNNDAISMLYIVRALWSEYPEVTIAINLMLDNCTPDNQPNIEDCLQFLNTVFLKIDEPDANSLLVQASNIEGNMQLRSTLNNLLIELDKSSLNEKEKQLFYEAIELSMVRSNPSYLLDQVPCLSKPSSSLEQAILGFVGTMVLIVAAITAIFDIETALIIVPKAFDLMNLRHSSVDFTSPIQDFASEVKQIAYLQCKAI